MKSVSLMIPAIAALAFAVPAQAAPASIAGSWKASDGKSVIQIYKCGTKMCGKISKFLVAEPKGGARDDENPDKAKRSRRLLGLPIFWSLTPNGDSYKGKGYSPEDGMYFDAKKVWRNGNTLNVKGCKLVFCKTAKFSKV